MENEKNQQIQVLRGAAIIAVVMIHTCPLGISQVYFRPFINFSVALFFFLSGYLTKWDNNDWYSLMRRRVIRVLIPYVIWTVIYTIPNMSPYKITLNLLTARGAMQLYFIFVYIQLVLLTPILCKLAKSKYNWICWTVIPIVFYTFKEITPPQAVLSWLWKTSFILWFPYYMVGLIMGNRKSLRNSSVKNSYVLCGAVVLSILLQIFEGYLMMKHGAKNPGTQLKVSSYITSVLCVYLSSLYIVKEHTLSKRNIICKVGNYSFGIFLCHILIIRGLSQFGFYSQIPFIVNSLLVLVFSYLTVDIASRLFSKKICKWVGFM